MNILIINPRYNNSSQQLSAVLKTLFKKPSNSAKGFTSVTDSFPENWKVKTVDMNYQLLQKKDVKNADFVLMSARPDQRESALKIFDYCKHCFSSIVVHGSVFTDNIHTIDHLVVGDVEHNIDQLIHDINAGIPESVYTSTATDSVVSNQQEVNQGSILDMFQRKNIPALE